MSAERLYRLALLAYPTAYRRERGDEIVATVLEGGEAVRANELVSLVLGGVAVRGRAATGGSWPATVRAGVRLAAFVLLWLYTVVTVEWAAFDVKLGSLFDINARVAVAEIVVATLNVFALVALSRGLWRAPLLVALLAQLVRGVVLGLDWTVWPWRSFGGDARHFLGISWTIVALLPFVPALLLAVTRPRGTEPDDRPSAWWPAVAVAVAVALAWETVFLTSWLAWPLAALLLLALVAGRRDPRLAIAGATIAALGAMGALLTNRESPWIGTGRAFALELTLAAAALAARAAHARRSPA